MAPEKRNDNFEKGRQLDVRSVRSVKTEVELMNTVYRTSFGLCGIPQ